MGALLCAGLVLSGATQLRVTGIPIGPGEILLLAWCALALLLGGTGNGLQVRRDGLPYLAFWGVSIVLLSFDMILAGLFARFSTPSSSHSFVAYLFVFLFLIALLAYGRTDFLASCCARVVALSAGALALLLVAARLDLPLGPLCPWYSIRFSGWAENPNTIAFQIAAIPFLGLFFWNRASRLSHRVLFGSTVAAALVVGWATFSDALIVAWSAAAVAFFALDYAWAKPERSTNAIGLFRYFLVPLVLVALAVTYSSSLYERLTRTSISIYEQEGGQGDVRVLLWRHGIEALFASPIVGLGPGGHSGVAAPFSGAEAHNSLIDWGTNTGIVGLVAYVALLVWIALGVWRARDPALVAALVATQALSMFHYTLRHPVFWFYVVAIHVLARRERGARARERAADLEPSEPLVPVAGLPAVSPLSWRPL